MKALHLFSVKEGIKFGKLNQFCCLGLSSACAVHLLLLCCEALPHTFCYRPIYFIIKIQNSHLSSTLLSYKNICAHAQHVEPGSAVIISSGLLDTCSIKFWLINLSRKLIKRQNASGSEKDSHNHFLRLCHE